MPNLDQIQAEIERHIDKADAVLKSCEDQVHLLPSGDCRTFVDAALAERENGHWVPVYEAGQREPVTFVQGTPDAADAWRKAKESGAIERRQERALMAEGRMADVLKAQVENKRAATERWYETASAEQIKAVMYKLMEADDPDMDTIELAAGYRAAAEVREEDEPHELTKLKAQMQRPHTGPSTNVLDSIFKWTCTLGGLAMIAAGFATGNPIVVITGTGFLGMRMMFSNPRKPRRSQIPTTHMDYIPKRPHTSYKEERA